MSVFRLYEEFPGVKVERGGADTDAGAPPTLSPESTSLSSLLHLSSWGDKHKSLRQTDVFWSLHHSPSLTSASVHPQDWLFIWLASPEIRWPNNHSCCSSPPLLLSFSPSLLLSSSPPLLLSWLFLFSCLCFQSVFFFMYVTADSRRTEDE